MLQTLREAKENYAGEWIAFMVKQEKDETDQSEAVLRDSCNSEEG